MTGTYCSYDQNRMAMVYKTMTASDKSRVEDLKGDIRKHLLERADIENRIRLIKAVEEEKQKKDREAYGAIVTAVAGVAYFSVKLKKGMVKEAAKYVTHKSIEIGTDKVKEKAEKAVATVALGERRAETIMSIISILTSGSPWIAGFKVMKPTAVASDLQEWSLGLDSVDEDAAKDMAELSGIINKYYGLGYVKSQCVILGVSNSGPAIGPR